MARAARTGAALAMLVGAPLACSYVVPDLVTPDAGADLAPRPARDADAQTSADVGDAGVDANANVVTCGAPLDAGLVAYWSFDDGTATDLTGHHHGGTLKGGATISTTGARFGQALVLDGLSGYVEIANGDPTYPLDFGTGDFTISAWAVFRTDFPDGGALDAGPYVPTAAISKGLAGACCDPAGYPGYLFGTNATSLFLRTQDTRTKDAGRYLDDLAIAQATPFTSYADGWRHFVGVRRGSELTLYVDTLRIATATLQTPSPPYEIVSNATLLLGASPAAVAGRAPYMYGRLDEVRLYERALCEDDIIALFRHDPTRPP